MKTRLQILLSKYKSAADKKQRDILRYQIEGEITRILTSTIDRYTEHLEEIVRTVSILMEAERVSLMVKKKNFLEIAAAYGLPEDAISRRSLTRIGTGIAGKVAQSGEAIFTGDLTKDGELKQSAIGGVGFKSNAFICLPLKSNGEVVGVINVSNPAKTKSFKRSDFNFLKKVAGQIATFLKKSMQFESMRLTSQKVSSIFRPKHPSLPKIPPIRVEKKKTPKPPPLPSKRKK